MSIVSGLLVLSLAAFGQGFPARIVGGGNAPNHEYPYQVSLRHLGMGHFCSGSILNNHWILTAAHCVKDHDAANYTLSVGTNYLNETGNEYSVQFHVIYEYYENYFYYDIALIRVAGEIAFDDFVKPVQLTDSNPFEFTGQARATGWGSIEYGGPMSNELQEIELTFITQDACRLWYPHVTPNHLCTFNSIGEGICKGDSGGPLIVDGVQVGIVSYIIPCAFGAPDVYTRVWPYKNWIDRVMKRFEHDIDEIYVATN